MKGFGLGFHSDHQIRGSLENEQKLKVDMWFELKDCKMEGNSDILRFEVMLPDYHFSLNRTKRIKVLQRLVPAKH